MAGEIDVPKVGPVKKLPLFIVLGGGVAYIIWRRYQAGQAAADTTVSTDGTFGDPGSIPSVDGAYLGQDVGLDDGSTTSDTSTYGFTGTTNSQWSQYAATQLSMDGVTSYTSVLTTLGVFLAGKALSTSQQSTVQAAIAVAGQPPEGSHPIISGGDTAITVAPTGLHGSALSTTSVTLSWTAVPGADGYHIYRTGVAQIVGETTATTGQVGGLTAGTTYTFQVAAHTGAGQTGPKSASASVKTTAATLKAPGKPIITDVGNSGCKVTWKAVIGATGYHVYRGGSLVGTTAGTWLSQTGLAHNTSYSWQVQAMGAGGAVSSKSASASARTKK